MYHTQVFGTLQSGSGCSGNPEPTPSPQPSPWPTPPAPTPSGGASEVLRLVNEERKKTGAPAVCLNEKLGRAAAAHTADMVRNRFLSHRGSDGKWPRDRVTRQGYSWRAAGENIARGQTGAQEVVRSWMNSPGHRRTILDPAYKNMGYAFLPASDSWRMYHTQVFGTLQSGGGCNGHPEPTPSPQPLPSPTPPTPSPQPSPWPTPPAPTPSGGASEVLRLVNAERKKTGAPAVCLNEKLGRAAAAHTADMVRNRFLSH